MRPVMPIVSIPWANTLGYPATLRREHLVGVQRVVVARRARVLHDLRALQVLDDDRGERLPGGELARLERHQLSTTFSVRTPTPRAVTTSSPCLVAVLGDRLGEHELARALALLLPPLARRASSR